MAKRSYARALAGAAFALTAAIAMPDAALAEDTQAMHRLYNPNSGEHFYTGSDGERDNLTSVGWSYEGVGWVAPVMSSTPVYRLYNAYGGDHHYTKSEGERDLLIAVGWTYEGVGWYSDDEMRVPLYRQYNPFASSGSHNYTTSLGENNLLVSAGWQAEGIGWYGIEGASPATQTPSTNTQNTAGEYEGLIGTWVGTRVGSEEISITGGCLGGKLHPPTLVIKSVDSASETMVIDLRFLAHYHLVNDSNQMETAGDEMEFITDTAIPIPGDDSHNLGSGYYHIVGPTNKIMYSIYLYLEDGALNLLIRFEYDDDPYGPLPPKAFFEDRYVLTKVS